MEYRYEYDHTRKRHVWAFIIPDSEMEEMEPLDRQGRRALRFLADQGGFEAQLMGLQIIVQQIEKAQEKRQPKSGESL